MVVLSLKTDSEIYIRGSTHTLKASSHLCFLPWAASIFILLFKDVCVGDTNDILFQSYCGFTIYMLFRFKKTNKTTTSINSNSIHLLLIKKPRKNKKHVHCPWRSREKVHHFHIYHPCATPWNKTKHMFTTKTFMPAVLKVEAGIFQNPLWLISIIPPTPPELAAAFPDHLASLWITWGSKLSRGFHVIVHLKECW